MRVHCSINDRKGQTGYYDIFKLFPDAFRVRFFVFHGVILATDWPCLGEVKTLCENAHFADRGLNKSRCEKLRQLKQAAEKLGFLGVGAFSSDIKPAISMGFRVCVATGGRTFRSDISPVFAL